MKGSGATSNGDEGLADVVSFADKAREYGRPIGPVEAQRAEGADSEPAEPETSEPAETSLITQGAMRRRLHELSRSPGNSSVDDELAKLVFDSATDLTARAQASIRSVDAAVAATRQMTFEGPELLLEVQVEGRNRELTCQVVPPQPATLEIRHARGSIDLGEDPFGTFFALEVPAGAVSLRCVPLSGRGAPTATSWVTL
jgi:hypothetical protein